MRTGPGILHQLASRSAALALLILASAPIHAVRAEPGGRVALVIGNSDYQDGIPALTNPKNDAAAMAATLRRMGFRTFLMIDATRAEMLDALHMVGREGQGAETALLFYAGHAVEVDGRNLLVAVSAHMPDGRRSLEQEAVGTDEIDAAIGGKAQATLVFLDACRDNPFAAPVSGGAATRSAGANARLANPGLAAVTSGIGMLYAFATAPGRTAFDGAGAHSPFTTALLEYLEEPAIDVREMLSEVRRAVRQATGGAQIPWDSSSLEHRVVLGSVPDRGGSVTRIVTFATPEPRPVLAAAPPPATREQGSTPRAVASEAQPPPAHLELVPALLAPVPRTVCQVRVNRGWVVAVGNGTITVNRDGEACAVQLFTVPERNIPASDLRVTDAPQNGTITIRGNSFAYRPNPGFAGSDRFGVRTGGSQAMLGVMSVTVR